MALVSIAACGDGEPPAPECGDKFGPHSAGSDDALFDEKARAREDCEFGSGSPVSESVGTVPDLSPLKHVIVIMRENRSFDHYLGAYTGRPGGPVREQDPPLGERANPDPSTRKMRPRFKEEHYCTKSPNHEWNAVHLQYNNGHLDGFVAATNDSDNNNHGCVAMGYYTRDDIPFYYWLADHFAISDRYHAAILGPTMPNIMFYYYASSCNATENLEASGSHWLDEACGAAPTIFKLIRDSGHTVQVYSDMRAKLPGTNLTYRAPELASAVVLAGYPAPQMRTIEQFDTDVANGTLADVVFVEPNYKSLDYVTGGVQNDEHPSSNIQDGENFVLDRIKAVMDKKSLWDSSVIFVTWDEHGGYYDHIVPPHGCAPDKDRSPTSYFKFNQRGFRTPFFAVSPFARENYVSHNTVDHTSITRFIEAWLNLGAMTKRDANAWPLFDMFKFDEPRTIDQALIDEIPALRVKSTDPLHLTNCDTDHALSSCPELP